MVVRYDVTIDSTGDADVEISRTGEYVSFEDYEELEDKYGELAEKYNELATKLDDLSYEYRTIDV